MHQASRTGGGDEDVAKKTQIVLLVDPEIAVRTDTLRIVMGVSRATVIREALPASGLRGLERTHAERISRLAKVASAQGKTLGELVTEYAKRHERDTYGETLEELEHAAGIKVPA
jgi:hypothetical protein